MKSGRVNAEREALTEIRTANGKKERDDYHKND